MRTKQQWEFTDGKGAVHRFEAIDGHSAWKLLAEVTSLSLPHSWNINIVCDCGKASPYMYCSKVCFDKVGIK